MDYTSIILLAAKKVGVSGSILLAICTHETGLKNVMVPHDGGSPTYGVCQVKAGTAMDLGHKGKPEDLLKVEVNAKYAALMLKKQYDRYDGNYCRAVAAYNAGSYLESVKTPGYPKNLKYVNGVKERLSDEEQKQLECKPTMVAVE